MKNNHINLKNTNNIKRIAPLSNSFIIFLVCTSMCILCSSVIAGTISIVQTSTASINDNKLSVEIIIKNEGDSPAFNLLPRVITAGKNISLPGIANLFPGKTYKQSTTTNLDDNPRGEFNVISTIDYRDEQGQRKNNSNNLYLNTAPIEDHPISIEMITESSDRTESKHIIHLKNLSRENIDVTLQMAVPDGIAINQILKNITLVGLSDITIPIILNSVNLQQYEAALLHAVIFYNYKSLQLSQMASTPVNVLEKENVAKLLFSSQETVLGLSGLFLGILIFVVIKNLRMKAKKS